ncbi:MAG: sugar phosphate isomerase/epimerase [Planctomycetes bacterium]|nr:sugar phosphate isomerase/epimerase [Planctomycetota bacterium]
MANFKHLRKEQFILSNSPFIKYTLEYALGSLQRLGAGKLEFYAAEPHFCMEGVTYADMKVFRNKLAERGLSVVEINPENCAYPMNLAAKNPVTRLRSFRYYENAIRTAGVIGAPYVVIFPGYATMDDTIDAVWNIAVDSMSRLADIAKTEGVTITFEATTRDLTVITDHKRIMKLIGDCGNDNLAVTIDMMCLSQTKETVQDVYDVCGGDKVVNVHYTDGGLLPSGSWEHRIPGEGDLDLDAQLAMFDANEYGGFFGNEVIWSIDPAVNTPELICQKLQNWWDQHFE